MTVTRTTPTDRLARRLVRTESGCLEWTGSTNDKGYGRIRYNGKWARAHRVAWELVHGPIPDGLYVCHACDNPPCCDVAHLFLGTPANNTTDKQSKGRGSNQNVGKTHCPADHEYTEANTYVDPQGNRTCRICKKARR